MAHLVPPQGEPASGVVSLSLPGAFLRRIFLFLSIDFNIFMGDCAVRPAKPARRLPCIVSMIVLVNNGSGYVDHEHPVYLREDLQFIAH